MRSSFHTEPHWSHFSVWSCLGVAITFISQNVLPTYKAPNVHTSRLRFPWDITYYLGVSDPGDYWDTPPTRCFLQPLTTVAYLGSFSVNKSFKDKPLESIFVQFYQIFPLNNSIRNEIRLKLLIQNTLIGVWLGIQMSC